jgi:hypothetical protein
MLNNIFRHLLNILKKIKDEINAKKYSFFNNIFKVLNAQILR